VEVIILYFSWTVGVSVKYRKEHALVAEKEIAVTQRLWFLSDV
jgi:hypothetical protein